MASKLVTVFGGSGFLGRQIVKCLAAEGSNVRVAVRHPERASLLKGFARDGQIELVRADVWDESTVARAVKKSTSVINTVGGIVTLIKYRPNLALLSAAKRLKMHMATISE
ncbi:MAG: SDR family NAD(P)-dependent oxidoreductase [Proteobacteria bacterium]|nr:SDR family NAD(P)-dependent oxidoreductase [Pseudomonadota bacterium]